MAAAEPAADAEGAAGADGTAEAVAAKPAQRRLWLTGSLGASPGAFGFFRTAHAEPLGDRLRLLLDYDLPDGIPPVTGTQTALAGVEALLARAEAADLAQNVFQGGVWGTLRC